MWPPTQKELSQMITRRGKKIFFNGVETRIFGRSSFKAMAHLRHGNDGGFLNWIDHNQRYGFNLLRVFGETEYWADHPMFGSPPKLRNVWNRGELESGHRPTQLTPANQEMIRKMFKYSEQTGMAFEYVVDATLKHAPRDIPWGTIGHCVRQTLAFMRNEQSNYPNALVMVNFHNEWDAHSKGSWDADDMSREQALREVNFQAMRARRWINGDEKAISYHSPGAGWKAEQWPEAVIIVDHGGRNEIQYQADTSPDSYDMYTLHPERSGEWWASVDDGVFNQYLRGELPTYFSESKMWVDPEDRDRCKEWYRNTTGWTTNWNQYENWMESCKDAGIHFVVHDEKGMQSASGWPRAETVLERNLGGSGPPPPPPPPPVEDPTTGKLELAVSKADTLGRRTFTVLYPEGLFPLTLEGGSERSAKPQLGEGGGEALGDNSGVLRCAYEVEFPTMCDLTAVDVFQGLDRGDIVEMDTEVHDQYGRAVHQNSDHKECTGNYPAWIRYPVEARTKKLLIHHVCRVNGNSEFRTLDLVARPHFGVRLQVRELSGSQPNGGANGGDTDENAFITMPRAEKEIIWINNHLNIWSGVYDVNYVVGHCKWALEGNPFEMTEGEMRTLAANYHELIDEGADLTRRLREEHPQFPGRSTCKKDKFSEFKAKLVRMNEIVEELRKATDGWPGKGVDYDSIKGFCQYCNERGITSI